MNDTLKTFEKSLPHSRDMIAMDNLANYLNRFAVWFSELVSEFHKVQIVHDPRIDFPRDI